MTSQTTGQLVCVVGPSGAGKDAVIRGVAAAMPEIHLARRVITRPAHDDSEEYDSVTDAVTIWLGPGIIVLVGLSIAMLLRQPLAGAVSLVVVVAYLSVNLWVTERYVRPSNLRSNALDSQIGGALAEASAARAKSARPLNLCETAGDKEGSGVQVQRRRPMRMRSVR